MLNRLKGRKEMCTISVSTISLIDSYSNPSLVMMQLDLVHTY